MWIHTYKCSNIIQNQLSSRIICLERLTNPWNESIFFFSEEKKTFPSYHVRLEAYRSIFMSNEQHCLLVYRHEKRSLFVDYYYYNKIVRCLLCYEIVCHIKQHWRLLRQGKVIFTLFCQEKIFIWQQYKKFFFNKTYRHTKGEKELFLGKANKLNKKKRKEKKRNPYTWLK